MLALPEMDREDQEPLTNEGLKELLDKAFQSFQIAGFTYGQTVPRRWFCHQLDIIEPSKTNSFEQARQSEIQWLGRFYKLRDRINEELKMYLRANNAKGYLIVSPEEQAAVVRKDCDDGIAKELRQATFWLSHINDDGFSDQQRKEMNDAIVHNSQLRNMFKKRKRGFAE